MNNIIKEILNKSEFTKDDIITLLLIEDKTELDLLREKAYEAMKENVGEKVYYRGLIEFSNICSLDCYYCGIRKSNKNYDRYMIKPEEVVEEALWCAEQGYGSVALQSGERNDDKFVEYVLDIIKQVKEKTKSEKLPEGVGITLSCGEHSLENYQRFYDAGAHRFLLRIETSNPILFSKLHPPEQKFETRIKALKDLKTIGYQVGTGVMIGLPEQTIEDLANDILFFKEMDIDMLGMGPYIVHKDTPMVQYEAENTANKDWIYKMAIKMIGVARVVLKDVNIASTTALQAMFPMGREAGLTFGANIIMPLMTPLSVRKNYQLYEGKPCLDELASECITCLSGRVESVNRTVAKDEWGDSQHYKRKYK